MKKTVNLALATCIAVLLICIPAALEAARQEYLLHPEWSASLEAHYQYAIYPRVFIVLVLIIVLFFYNWHKKP